MVKAKLEDIVQITNEANECYPCLVIVAELTAKGINGFITLPKQELAFVRLNRESYVLVGKALVTMEKDDD